jgi:glyoxylase-like metal-dependent hydrolase (beta-lactamase superfamily II)
VVQGGELEFARHANERTRATYLAHNLQGIDFSLLDGEREVVPGVRCVPTPGHTPQHQSILIQSGGETACFLADLVSTSAHLPLPWTLGFDVEPMVTIETRRRLYPRAEAEGWRVVFQHDTTVVMGRLAKQDKGFGLVDPTRLD